MTRTRLFLVLRVVLLGIWCMHSPMVSGQFCDSITPTFTVDLSASPYQTWTSPDTDRDGHCCGATAPDVCIEFIITLHPDAAAIVFTIASGAVPPGALFYQIDCGPPTPVGSPICLSGTGPFSLTFCKPGNNTNSFSIETIPNPTFGPDITLSNGCEGMLHANFYDETTVTWTSVTPDAPGTYDSYLDCTAGCDSVYLTGQPTAPATVGYLVCGMAANGCIPDPVCDTIFTLFNPPVTIAFNAPDTVLCYDETTLPVQAIASGGTSPYTYLWDTGETTPGIAATAGTHTVSIMDQTSCVPVQASITIIQTPMPTVNAGADIDLCAGFIGSVTLNGTATNTSGVIWTGGNGTFADSTDLTTEYTPSQSEINNGALSLILVSNDISGCPPVSDDLLVAYNYVTESVALTVADISCFGANDGSVSVAVTGINGPYSYAYDAGPATTTTTNTGLFPGIHTVMIVNAIGCDSTLNYEILEPAPLSLTLQDVNNVSCFEGTDGSATGIVTGGTQPYQFSWNTTPAVATAEAPNLPAGNYTLSITDANGCTIAQNVAITQPPVLTLDLSAVPPGCFGYTNGAISAIVTGGAGDYTYQWSGGQTSVNVYNIGQGSYDVTVTDSNGCTISDAITVAAPPQLTGWISNDTVVCPGSPFTLATGATGGTGTYGYAWSPTGQNTSDITTSTVSDQLYTCTITDNNGCTIVQDVQVFVETMDPDDVTAAASPAILCIGASSVLTGGYTGPTPGVTLTWQHCAACPAQTSVTPATTTTYTIVATNYCGQTIDASATVVVNLPPDVLLQPISGLLCPDEEMQFYNAGTNDAQWSYEWTFGDGTSSSSPTPYHSYDQEGIYNVSLTVTDDNGCSTTVTNGATITVNPQAIAQFSTPSAQQSILDPEFGFYNSSEYADSYIWTFGDGTSATTFHAIHTYEDFGQFEVQLLANNAYGCPDSTTLLIEVTPSFDIYVPNAFTPDGDDYNALFMVQGYGLLEEDFSMEIYNRWGELIYASTDIHGGWDGMYRSEKVVQDGVYTWVIHFKDLTHEKHRIEGHVSVLK